MVAILSLYLNGTYEFVFLLSLLHQNQNLFLTASRASEQINCKFMLLFVIPNNFALLKNYYCTKNFVVVEAFYVEGSDLLEAQCLKTLATFSQSLGKFVTTSEGQEEHFVCFELVRHMPKRF